MVITGKYQWEFPPLVFTDQPCLSSPSLSYLTSLTIMLCFIFLSFNNLKLLTSAHAENVRKDVWQYVEKRRSVTNILLFIFIAPACSRVRYRHPIFCPSVRQSVRLSVCLSTFMSTFDIYVKVSILINYKTKQPSNLA